MLFWSSEEQTTRREGSKSLPSPFKGGSRCYSGLARCRPRPVKATDPCLHHKKAAPWWQPPCWHLPCTGYRLPCLCKIPSGPPAPSSRFPPQATILHGRSRTNVQMAAGKRTRLSRLDRPQTDFNRQWRKCQCHRKKVYARALDCGGLRCEGLRWSAGDCGGLRGLRRDWDTVLGESNRGAIFSISTTGRHHFHGAQHQKPTSSPRKTPRQPPRVGSSRVGNSPCWQFPMLATFHVGVGSLAVPVLALPVLAPPHVGNSHVGTSPCWHFPVLTAPPCWQFETCTR